MEESTVVAIVIAATLVFLLAVLFTVGINDYWKHLETLAGCVQ